MMEIRTEIRGLPELQAMMAVAPNRLGGVIRRWVCREANSFLVSFRSELRKKRRKFKPGSWTNRIGSQFKYYFIDGSGEINSTAHMGVNFSNSKGWKESIAKMEEGYQQSSANALVIPISKGFEKVATWGTFRGSRSIRHLINPAYYHTGKTGTFKKMISDSRIYPIRFPRGLFFAVTGTHNGRSALLFRARRSISVPKQFSFIQAWTSRVPAIEARGEVEIDKAIYRVMA